MNMLDVNTMKKEHIHSEKSPCLTFKSVGMCIIMLLKVHTKRWFSGQMVWGQIN